MLVVVIALCLNCFICWFSKYILSASCAPGSGLGCGHMRVSKTSNFCPLWILQYWERQALLQITTQVKRCYGKVSPGFREENPKGVMFKMWLGWGGSFLVAQQFKYPALSLLWLTGLETCVCCRCGQKKKKKDEVWIMRQDNPTWWRKQTKCGRPYTPPVRPLPPSTGSSWKVVTYLLISPHPISSVHSTGLCTQMASSVCPVKIKFGEDCFRECHSRQPHTCCPLSFFFSSLKSSWFTVFC